MAHRDKRAKREELQEKRAYQAAQDFLNSMALFNEVVPDTIFDARPIDTRPPLRQDEIDDLHFEAAELEQGWVKVITTHPVDRRIEIAMYVPDKDILAKPWLYEMRGGTYYEVQEINIR